jgi:MGT family glycosyltransferase
MSVVLAYTSPAIGHVFPMTPLLLELRRRGHDVHVRTLASQVETLRGLGLSVQPIDPAVAAIGHTDWSARGARRALERTVLTFCERAGLDGPDLQRAIDEVHPDVVVVDLNAWGASLTAEAWGGPWAFFSPYTPPIRSRGTPPFGPGLAPIPGPVGRVRDALLRPLVLGAAEAAMTPRINALRRQRGLPVVTSADAFFHRADVMLVATGEPFEYPHPDWSGRVAMIGALPWEPPVQVPEWLDDLEGPLALVTTSSEYQADGDLVRAAVDGLAGEPFTVVVTAPAGTSGTHGDVAAAAGRSAGNVRVVDFVPHGPVLERAVVAVTHGGMGATQKALARGVPVCVVPFGRDQHEVAARVVHARAGTRLSPRRLTPESLRHKVRQAMTMAEGARRVAAGYTAAGGAVSGADHVEALLSGH